MNAEPSDTSDRQTYTLKQESELRVEVNRDYELTLQLTHGSAEIFGTPLSLRQPTKLRGGSNVAIFTWEGCILDLSSEDFPVELCSSLIYESNQTPMHQYLNTHQALQRERALALQGGRRGPRLMVVGPTDSGKSSLCRLLANYAVRNAIHPIVIDLDLGQGALTPPGTVSATVCEQPVDIGDGFIIETPLVYFPGDVTVSDGGAVYKRMVANLAAMLQKRTDADAELNAAGYIVNTMGWVDGVGYDLIINAAEALQVDRIVTLGADRLSSKLERDLKSQRMAHVKVGKLAKSAGVITRDRKARTAARSERVRHYFYGPSLMLAPAIVRLHFSELQIFRAGGGQRAPSTALPLGAQSSTDPLRVSPVTPGPGLLHALLAISYAQESSQLMTANVAGFLYVKDVDIDAQTLVCLAPCDSTLPSTLLLASAFKVPDFDSQDAN